MSLPPAGKLVLVAAGLLLVTMVVLLVAQLAILSDSREHIVAQDRKINRIVKGSDPVLDQIEPVADDARGAFRQATPFIRDLRTTMIPLLRDLRTDAVPLLRDLDDAGLPRLAEQGNELIDALRASEFIPRTLRAADLAPEAFRVAADVLEVQRRTLRTQRKTLKVQRSTRRIQLRTLDIQNRLLAIQEEALVHIRSIDRKTGGTAPAAGAPVPPR